MRLYFPVDLTGNVNKQNMIEKLVLGGTGTGELPILSPTQPDSLTSAPSSHAICRYSMLNCSHTSKKTVPSRHVELVCIDVGL